MVSVSRRPVVCLDDGHCQERSKVNECEIQFRARTFMGRCNRQAKLGNTVFFGAVISTKDFSVYEEEPQVL